MMQQQPFPGPISMYGMQAITGGCQGSDVLLVQAGNLVRTVSLVNVATIGLPLELTLYYNSTDTVLGPVGHLWRHNLMMNLALNGPPVTQATFTDVSGRQYSYVLSGGMWELNTSASTFNNGVLTTVGSTYQLTFPGGNYYTFSSAGLLTSMTDKHGNTTTLTYSSGQLTTVTEPLGRSITLGYTGSLLTSITDPNSNETVLGYDTVNNNLTQVMAPSGCVESYTYATPSNHLFTTRTDPNGFVYTYTWDGSYRLLSLQNGDGAVVTYAYATVVEYMGDGSGQEYTLNRTMLYDARGYVWDYRFDTSGNLWRIINPLNHWRRFSYDPEQQLIFESSGFSWYETGTLAGPQDNLNNTYRRYTYDANANLLTSFDAAGLATQNIWDANNNLLSTYPGQCTLAVQGNWVGNFGADGYLLCAWNNGSDLSSLPSYVASVSNGTASRTYVSTNAYRMDARSVVSPTGTRREVAYWENTGGSFTATVTLNTAQSFNLSVYTHCVDFAISATGAPYEYYEQTGRNAVFTVTDMNGTQTFTVLNNAPGAWVTFPVQGDATHDITIAVGVTASNTLASIAAIMFDPVDNHATVYTYNGTNDLLTVTDGLGNQTVQTWNGNGTLATRTDALSHETQFFYTDTYQNLTQITDAQTPTAGNTYFTYDLNGNMLTREDPNTNLWHYQYDSRNRLIQVQDPLSYTTSMTFDGAGNLLKVVDANGNAVQMFYSAANRLVRTVDTLGQEASFVWDRGGYLVSATDEAGRVTQYLWDGAGNLLQTLRPDGTMVSNSYDALGFRVAVTLPNGNLPQVVNANLSNAFNYIQNAGAETVDPFNPTTGARHWSSATGANVRDSTVSHSGSASLKTQGSTYWSQFRRPLPPGVQAVISAWARPDGTTYATTAQLGVLCQQASGATAETDSPTLSLPTSSTTWEQVPPFAFSVPGDSQFARNTISELRAYAGGAGSAHVWFDDFTLNVLSTSLRYDREGRSRGWLNMDGTGVTHARDRYGRLTAVIDSKGQATVMQYDALNRLVAVIDAAGDTTTFGWDAVSNLTSVTDPLLNITQYSYDPVNRLTTITYVDSTTEQFGYDLASNLTSYTNNRSQSRTLSYDADNRLTQVLYNTDSTTVEYSYDGVGNVLTRTERNGDISRFSYDVLYRLTGVERDPASGSVSLPWSQANSYDQVGNRTEFDCATGGGQFDYANFDTNLFGGSYLTWSAPLGYDVMNRLPCYEDRVGNRTVLYYDPEGRLIRVGYPNGSPNPYTNAVYDIMGRLLSLDTSTLSTDLLPLQYGYDNNSNRRAQGTGTDAYSYTVDVSNRLVEESINRFVERTADHFQGGTPSQVDATAGNVTLLALADSFSGSVLNFDRWRTAYGSNDTIGYELRQNSGLQLAWPRGYSSVDTNYNYGVTSPTYDGIGLGTAVWAGCENRMQIPSGNFDVQVNFQDFQGGTAQLIVHDTPLELYTTGNYAQTSRTDSGGGEYVGTIALAGVVKATSSVATTNESGMLRITRSGSTVTVYYWNTSTSVWVSITSWTTFITAAVYVSLYCSAQSTVANVAFTSLTLNSPSITYASTGTYTSAVFDAGQSVTWDSIQWAATTPAGTSVEFQVAVSNSPTGPFTYVGPDGTSATYFTTSGTALYSGTTGRYASYQATLSGSGTATPTLSRVDVLFAGTNPSTEYFFGYDPCSNLVSKVTETPASGGTVITETRTVNDLNQITQNSINTVTISPPANNTVNANYTFDASGNRATMVVGGNTTTYTWDDDNRLTQVVLPGNVTIGYTYDVDGRMLSRTDSNGTATFVWDGMDMVQETDYLGNVTRYYVVNGKLMSFDRQGTVYQVHSDTLGSIRKVTDPTGTVLATYDYDAWGNQLGSTSDSIPDGGMQYRFVGGQGVRWDAATSLYYMRQRWYDPSTGRFISRDPIDTVLRAYPYASNNPPRLVDPSGLCSITVGFKTIALVGRHTWLIVTEDDGSNPQYFSANPPGAASPAQILSGKCPIVVNHGNWDSSAGNLFSTNPVSSTLYAPGPCQQYIDSFTSTANAINSQSFAYNLFGDNSNAVTYTMLENAGLTPPPLMVGRWRLPGWGIDLLGSPHKTTCPSNCS